MTKMLNLRPVGQTCIVLRDRPETVSRGGIALPESAQARLRRGTVVAMGEPEVLRDGAFRPIAFGEGSRVLFGAMVGAPLDVADGDCILVNYYEILAVIEGD